MDIRRLHDIRELSQSLYSSFDEMTSDWLSIIIDPSSIATSKKIASLNHDKWLPYLGDLLSSFPHDDIIKEFAKHVDFANLKRLQIDHDTEDYADVDNVDDLDSWYWQAFGLASDREREDKKIFLKKLLSLNLISPSSKIKSKFLFKEETYLPLKSLAFLYLDNSDKKSKDLLKILLSNDNKNEDRSHLLLMCFIRSRPHSIRVLNPLYENILSLDDYISPKWFSKKDINKKINYLSSMRAVGNDLNEKVPAGLLAISFISQIKDINISNKIFYKDLSFHISEKLLENKNYVPLDGLKLLVDIQCKNMWFQPSFDIISSFIAHQSNKMSKDEKKDFLMYCVENDKTAFQPDFIYHLLSMPTFNGVLKDEKSISSVLKWVLSVPLIDSKNKIIKRTHDWWGGKDEDNISDLYSVVSPDNQLKVKSFLNVVSEKIFSSISSVYSSSYEAIKISKDNKDKLELILSTTNPSEWNEPRKEKKYKI